MKKLISLALALVFVLSMATVAFATTTDDDTSVDLKKVYKLAVAGMENPAETFTFKIEKFSVSDAGLNSNGEEITVSNMPTFTNDTVTISFDKGEATVDGDTNSTTLALPVYDAVGIYTYKITEETGSTAGVTYDSNPLYLKVTVIEENGKVRVAALRYLDATTGSKTDNITNTYTAGELDVTKTVTGTLGDKTKPFAFTVVFTAPEGKNVLSSIKYTLAGTAQTDVVFAENATSCQVKFNLTDGQTASFSNIPVDVTYVVTEDNYVSEGYTTTKTGDTGTISTTKSVAAFTNDKDSIPDTGINLDTLPFVLILAVCAGAVVLFVIKRRGSAEF